MTQYIDTNVFVRFLTRDDPVKAKACFDLLNRARNGEEELYTSETVIGEVVYVLTSPRLYGLSNDEVYRRLYPILALDLLHIPNKASLLRSLEIFAHENIDFEDCVVIAEMRRLDISTIYSYDSRFDRFGDIERSEP